MSRGVVRGRVEPCREGLGACVDQERPDLTRVLLPLCECDWFAEGTVSRCDAVGEEPLVCAVESEHE